MKTNPLIVFATVALISAFGLGPSARSEALTPYPLTICIVSGDKLDKDPTIFTYQGREIKTCCTDCIDQFYKDPTGYTAKIDEAAEKQASK